MNSWKSVDKGEYPENLETVWLTNGKGWIALGCLVETEGGWHWAESNGVIYSEGIKIVAERELDDLDVKFWHSVPTLPEYIKEKTVPFKTEDTVVKFVNNKQPDHIEGYHTLIMNKADKYLKETISDILENGSWDKNPRPRWSDNSPAHSKFVTQKVFEYNIAKGEYPITTLRTTALKGSWHDMEAIYIKQTNVLEEMHTSIHSWWQDFVVDNRDLVLLETFKKEYKIKYGKEMPIYHSKNIGATYGATVKRYNLMNKLLKGLEETPFGRRHIIDMWQEQQMIDDPKALVPCAYSTLWSVREEDVVQKYADIANKEAGFNLATVIKHVNIRYIDLTLMQRSMDYLAVSSINPVQYVMLGMTVCNHLTFKTGIKHELCKFLHVVQNCHLYDKNMQIAKELLERIGTGNQPKIELTCEPKDFYSHTWGDFKVTGLEGIEKLNSKIEIAI